VSGGGGSSDSGYTGTGTEHHNCHQIGSRTIYGYAKPLFIPRAPSLNETQIQHLSMRNPLFPRTAFQLQSRFRKERKLALMAKSVGEGRVLIGSDSVIEDWKEKECILVILEVTKAARERITVVAGGDIIFVTEDILNVLENEGKVQKHRLDKREKTKPKDLKIGMS
jgi:hypothetical protein